MKISDLRQKTKEELRALVQEKRQRLDELHFLVPQKKVKNVKEAGVVRRDIARILTLLKAS